MNLNTDIDNITLQVLESKLKNSVTQLDIIKWLSNFEPAKRKMAIDIAMNLSVFNTFEIEGILNTAFEKRFQQINKKQRLIVLPVGDFGKSGSMIAYYFQKTPFYKRFKDSPKVQLVSHLNSSHFEDGYDYILVLIDDFAGSGGSIRKFYDDELSFIDVQFSNTIFIGIASMRRAKVFLSTFIDEIHIPESNIFKRAFGRDSHYFGYRNYSDYRELCFEYGKKLTDYKELKNGTIKYTDALGFNNTQALVSFNYGSPNNTLPIIWSSRNGWIPLIPRFSKDKMSMSKDFRKSLSHELSLLKEFSSSDVQREFFTLDIDNKKSSFKAVSRIDFSLYGIIRLMRNGHKAPVICQKLGIISSDYDNIMTIGIDRGLFKEEGILSEYGLLLYQDAKRTIKYKNQELEYEKSNYFIKKEVDYRPKQFNGRS